MSVLSSQLPGSVGHQTYLLLRFHCDGDGLLPTRNGKLNKTFLLGRGVLSQQ